MSQEDNDDDVTTETSGQEQETTTRGEARGSVDHGTNDSKEDNNEEPSNNLEAPNDQNDSKNKEKQDSPTGSMERESLSPLPLNGENNNNNNNNSDNNNNNNNDNIDNIMRNGSELNEEHKNNDTTESQSPLSAQIAAAHNNPWEKGAAAAVAAGRSQSPQDILHGLSKPRSPPPRPSKKRRASLPALSSFEQLRSILPMLNNYNNGNNNGAKNGSSSFTEAINSLNNGGHSIISDFEIDKRRKKRIMNFDENYGTSLQTMGMSPLPSLMQTQNDDVEMNDDSDGYKDGNNNTNNSDSESKQSPSSNGKSQSGTQQKRRTKSKEENTITRGSDRLWQLNTINMKLQYQIEKYKEEVTNLQSELSRKDESCSKLEKENSELKHQLTLSQTEQNRELTENVNQLKAKLEKMNKMLADKDLRLATFLSNSMDAAMLEITNDNNDRIKNDNTMPSAPPLDGSDGNGLTLEQKFGQRPNWKEIYDRGIVYSDDPQIDASLQKSQQDLHRRRASIKLDNFLPARPSRQELENKNIMLSDGDTIENVKARRRRTSMQLDKQVAKRPGPQEIGMVVHDLASMEQSANNLGYASRQGGMASPTTPSIDEEPDEYNKYHNQYTKRRGRESREIDVTNLNDDNGNNNGGASKRRGRESREIDASQVWNDNDNGDNSGKKGGKHESRPTREMDDTWADEAIKDLQDYSSNDVDHATGNNRRRGRESMEIPISSDPTHRSRESREIDSSYVNDVKNVKNDSRRRGRESMELPIGNNGYDFDNDNNDNGGSSTHRRGRPSVEILDLAPQTPVPEDMADLIERPQLVRQRAVVKERLVTKLKQRPSIEDTISRGILFTRPDTEQTYSLYEQHRALQKRRASLQIEKMLKIRPTLDELHSKHIFYNQEQYSSEKQHKRKQSMQLNQSLKRRPSIEKLGLLFKDVAPGSFLWDNEFDDRGVNGRIEEVGSDPENSHGIVDINQNSSDTDHDELMTQQELKSQKRKLADLFTQGPRSSKPLHDSDFMGVEFDNDGTIRMSDERHGNRNGHSNETTNDKNVAMNGMRRRGSIENDHHNDVDSTKHFQKTYVVSNLSVSRVARNLAQRPNIQEMTARGLLYDHPSVSRDLIERQHRVQRRRASQKIDSFLKRRPSRDVLESKNIIYGYNDSMQERKEHKRNTSRKLESFMSRRGSNVMINTVGGVFVPYARMSSKDSDNNDNHDNMTNSNNNNPKLNIMSESVEDRISDMQDEIDDLRIQLKQKNEMISNMKQSDKAVEIHELRKRVGTLQGELDYKNKYLQDLTFYFNNHGISVPNTTKEMQRSVKKHLKLHLKERPSVEFLQSRNILPDEMILRQRHQADSLQHEYEASKKLHFRQKSKIVENMMKSRPTRDELYGKNIMIDETDNENDNGNESDNLNSRMDMDYYRDHNRSYDGESLAIYDSQTVSIGRTQSGRVNITVKGDEIEAVSTVSYKVNDGGLYNNIGVGRDLTPSAIDDITVLRNEVRRLHHVLDETLNANALLNRENTSLKDSLKRSQASKDKQFGSNLNRYSISEIKATDIMFEELERRKSEEQRISELESEKTNLQQKINELEDKVVKVEIARKRSETMLKEKEQEVAFEQNEHLRRRSSEVPDLVDINDINSSNYNDISFDELIRLRKMVQKVEFPSDAQDTINGDLKKFFDNEDVNIANVESILMTNNNNAIEIAQINSRLIEIVFKCLFDYYRDELDKSRNEFQESAQKHALEKSRLQRQLRELKPKHKSSMADVPNPFAVPDKDAALRLLNDPSAQHEFEMEREMKMREKQYVKDKNTLVNNFVQEIDRLRSELKQVGIIQQQRQKMKEEQQKEREKREKEKENQSYISSAMGYLTGWT